jgi:hypothetical protein
MDNSSYIWNKIAEWLMSLGLPYVSGFGAMMILLAAALVLLFILWLVFRKIRLWYWKTNIQVDTLKSIDVRLHNVEEKLSQGVSAVVEKAECAAPDREEADPAPEPVKEETAPESKGLTAVGRSGRIYTEAELELQIRE